MHAYIFFSFSRLRDRKVAPKATNEFAVKLVNGASQPFIN